MTILHVLILISVRGAGGRYTGPQEQWNTPTSVPSQWGGAGGVAYRPHFFKPTPASLGMQPHVRHAHVLSQQGSPQQQQQGVNSSWISEMEIRRRSELNQMMIAEKERQRQLVQRVRYYMYMYMSHVHVLYNIVVTVFLFIFSLIIHRPLVSFQRQSLDRCTLNHTHQYNPTKL